MAVALRLKRFGRLNHPTYRVVAADSRCPRDGRIIETLGYYLPKAPEHVEKVKLNTERVAWWLSVGAQPSETVRSLAVRAGVEMPVKKRRKRGKSKVTKKFKPPMRKSKKAQKAQTAAAQAASKAGE